MSTLTPIYDITPFTLLDYPDKVACIIWFAGCNMRCLYCYNPDIVLGKGEISYEDVLAFLETRKGMLEAVVLSGGECTMHGDLIELVRTIKMMGFLIKIDTNGSRPLVVEQLVKERLVDYMAIDFKAMPRNFIEQTGSDLFGSFERTITFLIASRQYFEIRTTVHSDLISHADFDRMVDYLERMKYVGIYYVQYFTNNVPTLAQLGFSNRQLKNNYQSRPNINVFFR
ncbi:Pyruvate formate-lyase 1-activating enzyme [compost metagenome]